MYQCHKENSKGLEPSCGEEFLEGHIFVWRNAAKREEDQLMNDDHHKHQNQGLNFHEVKSILLLGWGPVEENYTYSNLVFVDICKLNPPFSASPMQSSNLQVHYCQTFLVD